MRRLNELWVPAIVGAYGVAYYASTRGMPSESVAFPHFVTLLLLVMAVLVVATAMWAGRRDDVAQAASARSPAQIIADLRNPAIVFGTAVLYLALFAATNFVIATIAYLIATMVALRVHVLKSAIIAVAFTLGLYGVFGYLFHVPL